MQRLKWVQNFSLGRVMSLSFHVEYDSFVKQVGCHWWSFGIVSCDWWRADHVTCDAGRGPRPRRLPGELRGPGLRPRHLRQRGAQPRGQQVGCDWPGAGHVTPCSPLIGPQLPRLPLEFPRRAPSQEPGDDGQRVYVYHVYRDTMTRVL